MPHTITCAYCQQDFTAKYKTRKFCSRNCVRSSYKGAGNPNFGHRWGDAARQRAAERMSAKIAAGEWPIFTNTRGQLALATLLEQLGHTVQLELPVATYFVDIYDAENHVGYEVDGEFHTETRVRDAKRDAAIFEKASLPLLRIPVSRVLTTTERVALITEIRTFVEQWAPTSSNRRVGFVATRANIVGKSFGWTLERRQALSKQRKGQPSNFRKGNVPWSKGLTKESDARVARLAEKISQSRKGRVFGPRVLVNRTRPCVTCGAPVLLVGRRKTAKYCSNLCAQQRGSWNYGLTKATHPSLRQAGQRISTKLKGRNLGKSYEEIYSNNPDALDRQRARVANQRRCVVCNRFLPQTLVCSNDAHD